MPQPRRRSIKRRQKIETHKTNCDDVETESSVLLVHVGYTANIASFTAPVDVADHKPYLNVVIMEKTFPALIDSEAHAFFMGVSSGTTKASHQTGLQLHGYAKWTSRTCSRRKKPDFLIAWKGNSINDNSVRDIKIRPYLRNRCVDDILNIDKFRNQNVVLICQYSSPLLSEIPESWSSNGNSSDRRYGSTDARTKETSRSDCCSKMTLYRTDVQGNGPIRQWERITPPTLMKAAHAEVGRLLVEGIIEHPSSPWISCLVRVPKPDGKMRFCMDYRAFNEVIKKDSYSQHMDTLLDNLLDKRRQAPLKIDLSQAYHQILL